MAAAPNILSDLPRYLRDAVRFYWGMRDEQIEKQAGSGIQDQGFRSAVTGGAQMDGFIELLTKLVIEAGIDRSHVYYREALELPGYFRPTKQWDFLVVERHYDSAALLLSGAERGLRGDYVEPAPGLTFEKFARSLVAQVAACSGRIKEL